MNELDAKLEGLEHAGTIKEILEIIVDSMIEPLMSDEEMAEVASAFIGDAFQSFSKMNEDIETGVKNGYSPGLQVEVIRSLLRSQKQPENK